MSYYDNTVAYYDNQIRTNNVMIADCNKKISLLEDDIEELRALYEKVKRIDSVVETATKNTSNKIDNLPGVVNNPFSVLKMSFFSIFKETLWGPDRTKSNEGISNAYLKIKTKIKELENEIQELRNTIRNCNNKNSSLNVQKRNYISNMEKKIAEDEARRKAAQATEKKATTTQETKTTSKK